MTNTIIRNYEGMDNTEKATFLYDFALNHNTNILESVLGELGQSNNEPIFDLGEWLNEFDNNAELVQIVQQSDHFDLDDNWIWEGNWIHEGTYYEEFETGRTIIGLVPEETAIEWIANALEYAPQQVSDLTDLTAE